MRLNKAKRKRKRDEMDIIERIALVIIVVALLLAVARWAYDWGFKANENYEFELEHMAIKEKIKNALLEEGLKMNSEVIESLVKRKNELEKTHTEQARALRELANENLELKQKEVYNHYNLDNALISLNIENQRLKNQEPKYKLRIKELESACDRKNERIIDLEQSHERKDERIKNLEEVVLDLRIIVRALKKQILDEKLSSEEFNTLKKEG